MCYLALPSYHVQSTGAFFGVQRSGIIGVASLIELFWAWGQSWSRSHPPPPFVPFPRLVLSGSWFLFPFMLHFSPSVRSRSYRFSHLLSHPVIALAVNLSGNVSARQPRHVVTSKNVVNTIVISLLQPCLRTHQPVSVYGKRSLQTAFGLQNSSAK